MIDIQLVRYVGSDKQTTGTFTVLDGDVPVFVRPCIERGYLDNRRNISCVPLGIYDLVYEWSPKFNMMLWELKGVMDRSECKIHAASFWSDLNGCISIGSTLSHLGKDEHIDLKGSKLALNDFHRIMKGHTKARISITNHPMYRDLRAA